MKQELHQPKSMRLELKKSELVNLSADENILPLELTPQVAGGWGTFFSVRITLPTILNCTGDEFMV